MPAIKKPARTKSFVVAGVVVLLIVVSLLAYRYLSHEAPQPAVPVTAPAATGVPTPGTAAAPGTAATPGTTAVSEATSAPGAKGSPGVAAAPGTPGTPAAAPAAGEAPSTQKMVSKLSVKPETVIDYDQLGKNKSMAELIKKRKARYGLDKSIDLVVKPEEALKIHGTRISVQDIADEIKIKEGGVVEKNIQSAQSPVPDAVQEFGIHIVQPGDNIWQLHFDLIKEYFKKRGITVPPLADQPQKNGDSTGIGKLLKFSEDKVYVYNLNTRHLEMDLNLIYPNDKIVVYNMQRVFKLLGQIDYTKLDLIQFDGETLWIPARG